MYVDGDLRELD